MWQVLGMHAITLSALQCIQDDSNFDKFVERSVENAEVHLFPPMFCPVKTFRNTRAGVPNLLLARSNSTSTTELQLIRIWHSSPLLDPQQAHVYTSLSNISARSMHSNNAQSVTPVGGYAIKSIDSLLSPRCAEQGKLDLNCARYEYIFA